MAQSTIITTPTAEKGWAKRACFPERQQIPPPSKDHQRPCSFPHRRAGLLHPLDHARSSPSSTPASAPRVISLSLSLSCPQSLLHLNNTVERSKPLPPWLPKAEVGLRRETPRSRNPLLEFLPRDLPEEKIPLVVIIKLTLPRTRSTWTPHPHLRGPAPATEAFRSPPLQTLTGTTTLPRSALAPGGGTSARSAWPWALVEEEANLAPKRTSRWRAWTASPRGDRGGRPGPSQGQRPYSPCWVPPVLRQAGGQRRRHHGRRRRHHGRREDHHPSGFDRSESDSALLPVAGLRGDSHAER